MKTPQDNNEDATNENIQKRLNNLYSKQDLPTHASISEVEAMKARINELEAELLEFSSYSLPSSPKNINSKINSQDANEIANLSIAKEKEQKKANFLTSLLRAPTFSDLSKNRIASLQHKILVGLTFTSILVLIILLLTITATTTATSFIIAISSIVLYAIGFAWLYRGRLQLVSWLLVAIFYSVIVTTQITGTFSQTTILLVTIVIAMAGVLLKPAQVIAVAILTISTSVFFATTNSDVPTTQATIIFMAVLFALESLLLTLGAGAIEQSFVDVDSSTKALVRSNKQLQDLTQNLEQRVADRTHDMELASEVGQSITERIGNLAELLSQSAELIRSKFSLYYTQLYIVDRSGRSLVLRAGTGTAGTELMQRGHRLAISSASLNGRAALDRQAVIVGDTQASSSFLPNPLLPHTRSELAIPLIANNKVVGVLDMQNNKPETFSDVNLPAFQVLAGQLAIAIQNAALFSQAEESRLVMQEQSRRLTRSGWQEFMNAVDLNENIGYVFSQDEIIPLVEAQSPAFDSNLTIPIEVTGANIGEVQLTDEVDRKWTNAEIEIVRTTVARAGQHIENLRLLAQADRYRTEAEQVSRRLTREGWGTYVQTRSNLAAGYSYNLNEVSSLDKAIESNASLTQTRPITVRDETIGELLINVDNLHHNEDVNEIFSAVAIQLGDHIESLRLLEETEQQRADSEKLYEIGQKMSVAKDRQEIVAAVVENIGISQINRAVLLSYEYNEASELENIVVTANWYSGSGVAPTPLGRRYPANVFTIVQSFMGTEPGFVSNTQNDVRVDAGTKEVFQAQNIRAFISLPVWDETHQVGSLLLESEEVISFTGKELLPYLSIIQQLSNALDSQGLFEQTQKRAYELATVATVSTTASTVLDPDKLLQAVVDLTKERFNMYHTHIYLADESWNTLLLTAGAGEVGRQMVETGHAIEMDKEKSLVARAARERKAIIVNDVRSDADFLPNPMLSETRAEIAIPMIAGDRVLGVFDVQSNITGQFTEEDANIYTTLASQVAVALQNARLYVEQSATVTQLRELDRLKSSFLANMSHELRTPLNSILGFADVMLEELDGPLTENMANDLGLIQKNGQHLLHLINDVLDMAKIESGKMNLNVEKFILQEVIDEVTSITSSLAGEKSLSLVIEPDSDHEVEINADKIRLRQVMINLVNNAMKFTEKGKISIRAIRENDQVLITVKDTGIGIPPEQLESVFQEFTQVDTTTTRKAGGTGLGLPISRRLIQMHSGRLWAESSGTNGEGTTFYVQLPIEANINEDSSLQVK